MDSNRKVLMARSVAKAFLEKVATTGKTFTVYFPSEGYTRKFCNTVKKNWPQIQMHLGYDQATFLCEDCDVMDVLELFILSQDLDYTDL